MSQSRPLIAAALAFCAVAGSGSLGLAQAISSADREKIGLTDLINRLGAAAPNGAGINVAQVEAPATFLGSEYLPDVNSSQFSLDTIIPQSTGTASTHATAVGQAWYGTGGVSPGVSIIDVYNANNWLSGSLRTSTRFGPRVETRKVANHSWIGGFATEAEAQDALRRIDLIAERDNVVIVGAVNNGSGSSLPQFPTQMYNGIIVGLTSGNSSKGPTTIDPGRSKPDIVVPAGTASIGAAWVSGAASILLQAAGGNTSASQATTIKALLMAGATKSEIPSWSHTSSQPLDQRYGAGELNINNSHLILTSGQQSASNSVEVGLLGWDYATASPTATQEYYFSIPEGRVAQSVSIIAAWNRHIDFVAGVGMNPATLTPSMANIDLAVHRSEGFSVVNPVSSQVAISNSTVDNVEHIYLEGLTAGQYRISLPADQSWNYSLAWLVHLALPGDANGDGVVDTADYTIWADNYLQTSATFFQGDFNGDGIVDAADYTIWADNFQGASAAALPVEMAAAGYPELDGLGVADGAGGATVQPTPEPAAWILALTGAAICLALAVRRRLVLVA